MIPVDQETTGAGGDCLRAAWASVLELPIAEVPHFGFAAFQEALEQAQAAGKDLDKAEAGIGLAQDTEVVEFLARFGLAKVEISVQPEDAAERFAGGSLSRKSFVAHVRETRGIDLGDHAGWARDVHWSMLWQAFSAGVRMGRGSRGTRLPWGFCVAHGVGPRGYHHAVAWDAREPRQHAGHLGCLAHDPHPSREGLTDVEAFSCLIVEDAAAFRGAHGSL